MSTGPNPYQPALNLEHETVGGWILFFCISLSVLRPVIGGFQVFLAASAFDWSGANFLGRLIYCSAMGVELGVIGFGLVAGKAL